MWGVNKAAVNTGYGEFKTLYAGQHYSPPFGYKPAHWGISPSRKLDILAGIPASNAALKGSGSYTNAALKGGRSYTNAALKGGRSYTNAALKGGRSYTNAALKGGRSYTNAALKGGRSYTNAALKGGASRGMKPTKTELTRFMKWMRMNDSKRFGNIASAIKH